MIIKDYTLETGALHLRCAKVDFSKRGVYLIDGKNGSGKTSFVRDIIFGAACAEFSDSQQQEAYAAQRARLFAYVPQDPPALRISVEGYLTMDNPSVGRGELRGLMDRLGMDGIDFDEKVNKLSGGELTKLSVVSALAKETPYVFMDEPSNNLDNASAEQLVALVRELSPKRTFVIVSHDERLGVLHAAHVHVGDGEIAFAEASGGDASAAEAATYVSDKVGDLPPRAALKICNSASWHVLRLAVFMMLVAVNAFNLGEFASNYAHDDVLPYPNFIAAYENLPGLDADDLNTDYAKGAGIEIDAARHGKYITYADVERVAAHQNVEAVFMENIKYKNRVSEKLASDKRAKASVPEVVYANFSDIMDKDIFELKTGRTPHDGSQEIAIPEGMANELLGTDAEGALGRTVEFEGKTHTVVGITASELVWLPYTESDGQLFYRYDAGTYASFEKEQLAYLEYLDAVVDDAPRFAVFQVQDGYEESVQNWLVEQYPATLTYSNTFGTLADKGANAPFLANMWLVNALLALAISLVTVASLHSALKENYPLVREYERYYVRAGGLRGRYMLCALVGCLVAVAASVLLVALLAMHAKAPDLLYIQCANAAIVSVLAALGMWVLTGRFARRCRL